MCHPPAAIIVSEDGYREVLGAAEGMKEDQGSWSSFFQRLRDRVLDAGKVFPKAKYQRCTVHFYRNVFSAPPRSKAKLVAKMLKAIHAPERK